MKSNTSSYLASALVLALFSGAAQAGDCPGNLKKVKTRNLNDKINCLNAENAARIKETGTLNSQVQTVQNQANAIQAQLNGVANQVTALDTTVQGLQKQTDALAGQVSILQEDVTQLRNDVNVIKGLPKVDPIGVVTSDIIEAEVTGLGKVVSSSDGTAYVNATFRLKNISTQDLYLACNHSAEFIAADEHGIVATAQDCSGIQSIPNNSIIPRTPFTVVSPGSALTIGYTSGEISKDSAAMLGNHFSLGFNLIRYLEPNLEQSTNHVSLSFSFMNITATQ
jgi:archaellum component FlaC